MVLTCQLIYSSVSKGFFAVITQGPNMANLWLQILIFILRDIFKFAHVFTIKV